MSAHSDLVEGLNAILEDMMANAKNPESTRSKIVASGFVAGYLAYMIPNIEGMPDAVMLAVEAETDQFLASMRDRREARDGQ